MFNQIFSFLFSPMVILLVILLNLFGVTGCVNTEGLFQPTSQYVIPSEPLGFPEGSGPIIVRSGRNATVTYTEQGADGSSKSLNFVADASGVIGAQSAAVNAVESQRFNFVSQRLDRLEAMIVPFLPIASSYLQGRADLDLATRASPPPDEPNAFEAEIQALLRAIAAKVDVPLPPE